MFFTHPHHAIAATLASKPAPGARSEAPEIVPREAWGGTSVRGAMNSVHLFSSNGQHEAASTPPLEDRAGTAFEFGLLMLVTRTRG